MPYRVAPREFLIASPHRLYGPGRHWFDDSQAYNSYIIGATIADDGVTPDGFVQNVDVSGVAAAMHRLAHRLGHVGGPPITIASL